MEQFEELLQLFRDFGDDVGIEVAAWDAEQFWFGLEGEWNLGETMDRFGDQSSYFGELTHREKILARSVKIPLKGKGRRMRDFFSRSEEAVEDGSCWTLPQHEIVEKAYEVFDTLSDVLAKDVDRVRDFFYYANEAFSVDVPPAIAGVVAEIAVEAPGYEWIGCDEHLSFDGCAYPSEIMDEVIAQTWRIAKVSFVSEEGDEIATDESVAWPVEDQDRFLAELFIELGGMPVSAEGGC